MSISLNYKTHGEGQPFLILHGLFGSLDNWQTMARQFASKGLQVITIDLRNHGKSPHTDDVDHEIMAKDVANFIKEHQLKDVILMGHSMGGKTAMKLALTEPELLSKLIVVDIAPRPYQAHHNIYFDSMMNLDLGAITSRSKAQEMLGQSIKNQSVLQFLLKNLDRKKDGTYNWKFNLEALNNNYSKLINGITSAESFDKPSFFIDGQLSDYITPADHNEISSLFPQAVFTTVAGAGHWVHAEKPQEFFTEVLHFIEKK